MISPTAIIDPSAQLGNNVFVGPYVIIENNVTIGNGTRINAHAHIKPFTIITTTLHFSITNTIRIISLHSSKSLKYSS